MNKIDLRTNRRLFGSFLAAALAANVFAASLNAGVYAFAPLAGAASVLDHTDGTGGNARFFNPTGVAVDGAGNIYVADGGDHTVRKVTAGGGVSTFAGTSGQSGSRDGTSALFLYPYAVAVDGSGNVYVADTGNNNIRKISASGNVSTLAGNAGLVGSADGTGSAATFNQPQGITVDAAGNVYVSDTNNSTLRKITAAGVVTTLAGVVGQTGGADGTGASARFNYPAGLAVDSAGNIYVADFDNSTIRKVTSGGSVSTLAGSAGSSGTIDGTGGSARFDHPAGVSVDAAGNVYVIDTSNQTIREITSGGSVSTLAGTAGIGGHADGSGAGARFFYSTGIASTASGAVYVADTGNHSIRAMTSPGVVNTLAGSSGTLGSNDGTGSSAHFAYPYGVASGSGKIFVADTNNNTIRTVTSAGAVSTLAGSGLPGAADGAGGAAQFNGPTGVAVDGNGNVFVADRGNSTIRKITAAGAVSTFAGTAGVAGSSDGTGAAARFNAPQGVAVDNVGNVYVADTNNNTIRKITSGGSVTTLAGAAGQTGSGDGAGGSARFNGPYGVAVDSAGNIYVADHTSATIRKIDTSNTVSTLAGTAGQLGFTDGAGFAAKFNQPSALAVDGSGNVFVADTYNRAIREISPGGSVTTLNGSQARFYYPQGIAVDASGNVYVADGDNQAIDSGASVVAPPSGTQVSSQSVTSGQNATFTVAVPGAGMTFQWQTSVDGGTTWSNVNNNGTFGGATTATLTVNSPASSMSGDLFRVQLVNPAGSNVSGSATLTVSAAGGGGVGGPPTGSARITNLSIRSYVGTGAQSVTVGFAISGSGSKQMLIRGIGPTLSTFGVGGVLGNPQLGLFNSSQVQVDTDIAWGGSTSLANVFAAVGAFALPPTSADSALFDPLAAGTTYTAQVSGVNGTTGIALAELYDADAGDPSTRLVNVSARALSGTGSSVLIAGFYIGGSGTETLLIRGVGPGLTQYGVGGVLATPQITIFDSTGTAIGTNTGWGGGSTLAAAFAQVGAFSLDPASADSAMLVTLSSGSYTVEVAGTNNTSGIALVEVYEMH